MFPKVGIGLDYNSITLCERGAHVMRFYAFRINNMQLIADANLLRM